MKEEEFRAKGLVELDNDFDLAFGNYITNNSEVSLDLIRVDETVGFYCVDEPVKKNLKYLLPLEFVLNNQCQEGT